MKKHSYSFTIIIIACMVLGGLFGMVGGPKIQFFSISFYPIIDLLGTLFLNALLLLVVPLLFSSIVSGMVKMQKEENISSFGIKMITTFLTINFLAILTGALFFVLFKKTFSFEQLSGTLGKISTLTPHPITEPFSVISFLKEFIPSSIAVLLSGKTIIAVIIAALFFGYAIAKIPAKESSFLSSLWESMFLAILYLTKMLMKALPLGVFALVARQFSQTGVQVLETMGIFVIMVILALLFFVFVPLSLILKYVAKTSPFKHLSNMFSAIVTAFSTTSSAATMPITLECLEINAKVPNKTTSIVLPLGLTLNMAGSALFVVCASLFLAGVYGMTLNFSTIVFTIFITFIASLGIAGIPSASIVSVIIVLQVLGIPQEAIGILFAVEGFLNMARTPVNTYTASCSTMIVHRLQNVPKH